jgi:hypothetical protein
MFMNKVVWGQSPFIVLTSIHVDLELDLWLLEGVSR